MQNSYAQKTDSFVQLINPKTIHTPNGYSHLAEVDLGNCRMIILSGQVALDTAGKLVGNGDLAKQTEQVFLNMKNAIESVGGTMDQLIKLNFYLLEGQEIQAVRNVRDKFINTKRPPASTLVKVSGLFREDILIEIEGSFIIQK